MAGLSGRVTVLACLGCLSCGLADDGGGGAGPQQGDELTRLCLLGEAAPLEGVSCSAASFSRACLRVGFRPWSGVTERRFQGCLACCLGYWMETLGLNRHVDFWSVHMAAGTRKTHGYQAYNGVISGHNDPMKIAHMGVTYFTDSEPRAPWLSAHDASRSCSSGDADDSGEGTCEAAKPVPVDPASAISLPRGALVYIQTMDRMVRKEFLFGMLDRLDNPVVLAVLGDNSEPFVGGCPSRDKKLRPMDMDGDPRQLCPEENWTERLEHPKLLRFLSANPSVSHPKVLGYPRAVYFPPEVYSKELRASGGREAMASGRSTLLYCAGLATLKRPNKVRMVYGQHGIFRGVEQLHANGFNCAGKLGPQEFIRRALDAKFVAAPRGFGRSVHRVWEALLMGAVPVTEADPVFDADVHQGLPIVTVQDWSQVTAQFLEAEWRRIQERAARGEYDEGMAKVYWPYWFDRFVEFL